MKGRRSRKDTLTRPCHLVDATPELRNHHDVVRDVPTDRPGVTAMRVASQRTIDRLLGKGRISRRQHDAAERLYRSWWRKPSTRHTKTGVDLSAVRAGPGDPESLIAAQAEEEYDNAMAVLTQAQQHCVRLVVIWDWAPRNKIGVLERALTALVRHYRL